MTSKGSPTFRAYIATSVEGYIARADGAVDWLEEFGGEDEDYGYGAFIAGVDAIVIGRTTYDQVIGFGEWPYAGKRTYVLSSRPIDDPPPDTTGWTDSVDALIAHLQREHRGVVWLLGGANSLSAFRKRDAIDEYEIFVMPLLLGAGIPLFEPGAEAMLRLASHTVYPSGVVRLVYAPVRG